MTITRSNTKNCNKRIEIITKSSRTEPQQSNNKKSNVLQVLERVFHIDKIGCSEFISIDEKSLRKKGCKPFEIVLFQSNNGVSYLRRDSPICRKYLVERNYNKSTGSLIGFKLVGFNKSSYYSRYISKNIRKRVLEKYGFKCIWCGSKDKLEVDHKNGRYNRKTGMVEDFQILCKSCNDKKRERCNKCRESKCRFNVQKDISSILYKSAFISGNEKYNEKQGCKGCFLYDIEDFYLKHDAKNINSHHEINLIVKEVKSRKKSGRVIFTQTLSYEVL